MHHCRRQTFILVAVLSVSPCVLGKEVESPNGESSGSAKVESSPSTLNVSIRVPRSTLEKEISKVKALSGDVTGDESQGAAWIAWKSRWRMIPSEASVVTEVKQDQGRIIVKLPVRMSLELTDRNAGAFIAGVHFDGCDNMSSTVNIPVALKPGDVGDIVPSVGAATVGSMTGKCDLKAFLGLHKENLHAKVRAGILKGVKEQDLPNKVNALVRQVPSIESVRAYLGKRLQVAGAWVETNWLGYRIDKVTSTKNDLRIHLSSSIRPRISFSAQGHAEERLDDCLPGEHEVCLPLALVLPRTSLLSDAMRGVTVPHPGYQLIPVGGRDLAMLRHQSKGRDLDIVFLSGSAGLKDPGSTLEPLESNDVLAEAAAWLADERPWPERRRPVPLDPLYQQAGHLKNLLDGEIPFDLGPGVKLYLRNAHVSMSGLQIASAELRAFLQLGGRAYLDIDVGQF